MLPRAAGGQRALLQLGDDRDLDWIADFGGIRYQLLSHRDESGPSLDRIRTRFGSKLGCSALEAPAVAGDAAPIDLIFEEGERSLEDIEIIHTPGRTDGSICIFCRAPAGKSYLFCGDTIFRWNARWATLVLRKAGGSEEALLESLLRLRELEPDVVLWSGFVGDVSFAVVTREEWTKAIDDTAARLRRRG
ncbi:MAG: MBL fold metallo-hydrolase [Immundisolibacterales bacterium]|nr:MBL fold metallo-hydrolase [Immundisolibacterales bacterium]